MIESILAAIGLIVVGQVLVYAYNRWIQPRRTRRWIEKTLEKIQAGELEPPPKQSTSVISFDRDTVTMSHKHPIRPWGLSFAWADVMRVMAFKRDWLTVDCICIVITTKDGLTTEVDEEMTGWETFTEALPKYLPGSREWADCYLEVAFPAFATNETLIFASEPSHRETRIDAQ